MTEYTRAHWPCIKSGALMVILLCFLGLGRELGGGESPDLVLSPSSSGTGFLGSGRTLGGGEWPDSVLWSSSSDTSSTQTSALHNTISPDEPCKTCGEMKPSIGGCSMEGMLADVFEGTGLLWGSPPHHEFLNCVEATNTAGAITNKRSVYCMSATRPLAPMSFLANMNPKHAHGNIAIASRT